MSSISFAILYPDLKRYILSSEFLDNIALIFCQRVCKDFQKHAERVRISYDNYDSKIVRVNLLDRLALNGDLKLLKKLHQDSHYGPIRILTIKYATIHGSLPLLKYCHRNVLQKCNTIILNNAVKFDHIHILEWLLSTHPEKSIQNTLEQSIFDTAVSNNKLDIIKHFKLPNSLTSDTIFKYTLKYGSGEIFSYIINQGVRPNPNSVLSTSRETNYNLCIAIDIPCQLY
jgi:hypothetical protein